MDESETFHDKKCKKTFKSYEAFLAHKVGDKSEQGKRLHITCDVCGQDFKTLAGLRTHREDQHRGPQNVVCPQCHRVCVEAGDFAEHLEKGWCKQANPASGLTPGEFHQRVQLERRVNQTLRETGEIFPSDGLETAVPTTEATDAPAQIPSGSPTQSPSLWPDQIHSQTRTDAPNVRHQCTKCRRVFQTASAVIRHAETSRKCGIKYATNFGEAIEEMSGGLLQVVGSRSASPGASVVDGEADSTVGIRAKIEATRLE